MKLKSFKNVDISRKYNKIKDFRLFPKILMYWLRGSFHCVIFL
nr:MAG TPA: hypothetical protein [Caudoviricetes sp.]